MKRGPRGGGRPARAGAPKAGAARGRPGSSSARRGGERSGLGGEQVEGRQAVRELLRAGRRRVHFLVTVAGIDESGSLGDILALARERGVALRRVERTHLDALALSDAPQGVLARADPLPEADLATLTTRSAERTVPFLVVLDGVTDPHNLGAVMRSAVSAGATGLVVGRHRSAGLTPAALKAAAGAAEYLPIATVSGIPSALAAFGAAGVWSVALHAGAGQRLWDLQVASEPVALVLGSEGRGLSRLVRQRCDLAVDIPLVGPIGSLNVAAAATLACFEVARRRGAQAPTG
jgi:23S rRNA (guanosine2251-2'-O)-methyltransferase